jgi:transcriptional regulator with XRE-family HTH domain
MALWYIICLLKRQKWRVIMDKSKDHQEYMKELGQKIKLYRIMKEMSQQDLEDKTGISKRSISRLEQGKSVQLENLFKILLALDLGENIELLVPDQTKRPSYYLKKTDNKAKRVRKKTEKNDFKWGDEV